MFPTKEAFDKHVEKPFTKAEPWASLKVNEIYRIDEKKIIPNTKFGEGLILRLADEDGNTSNVWATRIIAHRLLDGHGEKLPCFIRPLGLKQCTRDTSRSYHHFQLVRGDDFLGDAEQLAPATKKSKK